jgi:hypothetical protein
MQDRVDVLGRKNVAEKIPALDVALDELQPHSTGVRGKKVTSKTFGSACKECIQMLLLARLYENCLQGVLTLKFGLSATADKLFSVAQ